MSPFDGRTIDEEEFGIIARLVRELAIESVVEFGMGVSTHLFRTLKFYAGLETHEPTIACFPELDRAGKVYRVDLYREVKLLPVKMTVDLVFVDAPEAWDETMLHESCARFFPVQAAAEIAEMIIMHDTKREGERATISRLLGDWTEKRFDTARGLSLFNRKRKKSCGSVPE